MSLQKEPGQKSQRSGEATKILSRPGKEDRRAAALRDNLKRRKSQKNGKEDTGQQT